ncbi:MAG TPA: glycosyl hydrolase family 65 protein [Acidimicrobiales bacterium]|nr:glycosyl hydrolase family 65 protein [Acidimicrobiales bacterium]
MLPDGLGAALPPDPTWQFVVADGPALRRRVEESWLCVADGELGTRAVLEEDGDESGPGVVAAGIYDRGADGTVTLAEAPSWVQVGAGDGLPPGRRVLDLRDGVLVRETADEAGDGWLRSARFACIAQPGTEVLAVELDDKAVRRLELTRTSADPERVDFAERRSSMGGGILAATRTRWRPGSHRLPARLERIAAYAVAPRRRPSRAQAEEKLAQACARGAAGLLEEQRRAWAARWEHADVEVVGDPELTLAVRLGLFHLMASVADRGEAALGPRGLSGPAYAGHVLWDADVFVLPFLAATHPPAARALLEYRIRRLPAARRAAALHDRDGARFPWESADDGADVTPTVGIDEHGTEVPILAGRLEEHITADVAWAAWQLAAWSGRFEFLDGPGRPLVVDTARYWASRVRVDETGKGHLDGVIGPDEYHEDVDDNAFTNNLAAWNLRRAAELVERQNSPGEADEAAQWSALADGLADGYDSNTGIYEQFAGYDRLQPITASDVGSVPFAGDLVLGRARLVRTQLIKQADVLMLHHMVPDATAPGSLGPNLEHYLPRTCHGSSLSPSVHAAALARAGRVDEARSLLELAVAVDLDDLTATTAAGLHLANLGGIWQALVEGFAGVRVTRPDDRALFVDPRIPTQWEELRVRLSWHGRAVRLRCKDGAVEVGCDLPLVVQVGGRTTRVEPPGRWLS